MRHINSCILLRLVVQKEKLLLKLLQIRGPVVVTVAVTTAAAAAALAIHFLWGKNLLTRAATRSKVVLLKRTATRRTVLQVVQVVVTVTPGMKYIKKATGFSDSSGFQKRQLIRVLYNTFQVLMKYLGQLTRY